MELNKQVCSLELSKKLKELGEKQESLFYWTYCPMANNSEEWTHAIVYGRNNALPQTCSAFTVAELGSRLPTGYATSRHSLDGEVWYECYSADENAPSCTRDENEANVRAEMICRLLENNRRIY